MRTTVEFEEDTAAAIQRLRRETGMGMSEAVNELIRKGLLPRRESVPFVQKAHRLGLKFDVSKVAEALDVLEGPEARVKGARRRQHPPLLG